MTWLSVRASTPRCRARLVRENAACQIGAMLRVAVIGSGPGGAYAVGALTEHDGVQVDVIDRLPAPFGLVRYGVAPDHPKIRSISSTMSVRSSTSSIKDCGMRPAIAFLWRRVVRVVV